MRRVSRASLRAHMTRRRVAGLAVAVVLVAGVAWWGLQDDAPATLDPAPAPAPTASANTAPAPSTPGPSPAAATPAPLIPSAALREDVPACMSQPGAPPRRVAGRVLFEGQPVADALVRLQPTPSPEGLRVRLVRTGADGRFDFGLQAPLRWAVAAAAPGRTEALASVDLRDPTAAPAPDALELILLPCDARLTGHVLDSGSGPIEHARVRPGEGVGVETNARGEYELCLSPGRNLLNVSADGYGPVWLNVLVLGRTTRDILLAPEAFLVGRVVDEANAAVPDALVIAWSQSPDGASSSSALTGADGRFRLSVAPAEYRLSARSTVGSTSSVTTATAIVGRVSDEVVLRLKTKGRLTGHVRSEGKPIAGARVEAMGAASARGSEAVSQDDGSFVMTQVPEGDLVFLASPWEVVSPKRFTLKTREATVELEVKAMASLHGVVTREGKPVAGAEVQANAGMRRHDTTTDAKGRYVLRGLSGGEWTAYATSVRAGAFVEAKVTLAEREDKQLDLELSSAATISGRVVSETGEPVPGAFVVYELPRTQDQGRSITDADGRFSCDQMTGGGEYQPTVYPSPSSRTPFKPVAPPLPKAKLQDGSARVEGVTLAIKYERLTISGRVVDPSGAPVPDAKVRAASSEGQPPNFSPWLPLPSALADAQGAFTLEALTSGTWAVQARTPEGAEAIVTDVAAGAKGVVITVRPPGGIEGTLSGYEEPPVVYARALGQPKFFPAQVDGSTFRIQLAAGTWVVTAMNLHEGDAQKVEVQEGVMAKVAMTSHGRGSLAGSVVEHTTRAPVPNLVCHTVVRTGDEPGITNWDENLAPKTDAAGQFTVDPAPAGDVSVSCFGDWQAMSSASAQVTVPRGGKATVALEVVKRSGDTPGDIGAELDGDVPHIALVNAQGPAAKAGLRAGDVIVSVDGAPVAPLDSSGVAVLINNHPPGTKVALGVLRGAQPVNVTLTTRAPQ